MSTRLTVCVGGGGVGKTTTAAALALAVARRGSRTLVITVDPARRLADAMGADICRHAQPVQMDDDTDPHLFARMPDPRASIHDFIEWLFQDPQQCARVKANAAFQELGDSMAGVHELVTVGLLQTEVDSGRWDRIVLDTAPSRHALAFLTYPARLLGLLEARALAWLAALAQSAHPSELDHRPTHGLFAWGRSKAESIVGKLVGLEGLRSVSALFGDMLSVRERWAALAHRTNQLLRSPETQYVIIGTPAGGALDDVRYLVANLSAHGLRPSAVVLNRADMKAPACVARVSLALDQHSVPVSAEAETALRAALHTIHQEHLERGRAAQRAIVALQAVVPPDTQLVRLPLVYNSDPRAIVLALAHALGPCPLVA